MRQVGEPSVEEILESIKKVIARDNRSTAADERRLRESRGVAETVHQAADDGDEVLDLADSAEFAEDFEADQPEDVPALVTEDARTSMRESLAALAMLAEPGAQPQIVRSGETSLEGLARDLLRPALAEWLDKNLPPMVERLVAAEITRIVGKRG
jgi:cell pole-organizing protein PopZ